MYFAKLDSTEFLFFIQFLYFAKIVLYYLSFDDESNDSQFILNDNYANYSYTGKEVKYIKMSFLTVLGLSRDRYNGAD